MIDILAIGELLIDFSPAGKNTNPLFEMNPGGAAANVLAACAALGGSTEFVGSVGMDDFGDFLEEKLKEAGVGTAGLVKRGGQHTKLAFVKIDEDAVPSFTFIKEKGSSVIRKEEIRYELIQRASIIYFGSVCFTSEESAEAIREVLKRAKLNKHTLIAFDPNYRPTQWENIDDAQKYIAEGIGYADIVKLSRSEALMITGEEDYEKAAEQIFATGKTAVYITLGEEGTYFISTHERGIVESREVQAVDTTGCGDAFMGALLFGYLNMPSQMQPERVRFANAAGALCATKSGAMPAMPTMQEVTDFMMESHAL